MGHTLDSSTDAKSNRYSQLIEQVFFNNYSPGATEVSFAREELVQIASTLGMTLPKNLGDVIYTFQYRSALPASIREKAPSGLSWLIRPAGRGLYSFVAAAQASIVPRADYAETKIPDSTPGVISKYALSDEQALLARLRYNRLVDVFLGLTCYSLQNHLRTGRNR